MAIRRNKIAKRLSDYDQYHDNSILKRTMVSHRQEPLKITEQKGVRQNLIKQHLVLSHPQKAD